MIIRAALLAAPVFLFALAAAPAGAEDQPPPRTAARAARPQPAGAPHRVFVGINAGWQSNTLTFTDTGRKPVFQEDVTWTADYAVDNGLLFDATVGSRAWRNLFAEISYSHFRDEGVAAVTGRIPNPFFFGQDRIVSGDSSTLAHQEQGLHFSAAWQIPGRHLELMIFGGPSLFFVKRDIVQDLEYTEQGYPYDVVNFTGTQSKSVKDTALGGHAGADVAWYFTPTVGVGGVVRFARATAELPNAAGTGTLSLDVGGFQAGVGVRLRLGARRPQPPRRTPPRRSEPAGTVGQPRSSPTVSPRPTAVTIRDTPVFIKPDARQPLKTLASGTSVRVLAEEGEWLKVEFSDRQWGTRVGYVRSADLQR